MEGKCTVYFEEPFWVGIFERNDGDGYSIARHVFGAEPSDAEIYRFVIERYSELVFSLPGKPPEEQFHEKGFKRRQREARRQTNHSGIGTYAQQAIQAEYERRKQENKQETRLEREQLDRERFTRKQEQKKQKHRGR